MADAPPILICGGGIAGLTAALCLARQGFTSLVLERRTALPDEGAGIQLSPNAFNVLNGLGLSQALDAVSAFPERINIRDAHSGGRLASFPLGGAIVKRHGAPYGLIHRADLLSVLYQACKADSRIDLHLGAEMLDVAQLENHVRIQVRTGGDEQDMSARAIIGADGVWSSTRSRLPGTTAPQFTGHVAWRAVIDAAAAPENTDFSATGLWLGSGAHLVHYPVASGAQLNLVAVTRWRSRNKPSARWLPGSDDQHRLEAFTAWHREAGALLEASTDWGGWPLFAFSKPQSFAHGAICLIGDAAHAMLPYAAQGGAMAIEDAVELAAACALSPDHLPSAFASFERTRHDRIARVMGLARSNRRIYHLPLPFSLARNLVMRFSSHESLLRRMDWLYGWEAATLPK